MRKGFKARSGRLLQVIVAMATVLVTGQLAAAHVKTAQQVPLFRGAPIVAEVVTRQRNADSSMQFTNLVMISSTGMRMASDPQSPGAQPFLFIQNFQTGQAWMLDTDRHLFAELPPEPESDPGDAVISEDGPPLSLAEFPSGILMHRACMGQPRYGAGTAVWRGNPVTVWVCRLRGGYSVRQYFSPYWNLVVREDMPDGQITELRNIRRAPLEVSLFSPPQGFQKISLPALLGAAAPLQHYQPGKSAAGADGPQPRGMPK